MMMGSVPLQISISIVIIIVVITIFMVIEFKHFVYLISQHFLSSWRLINISHLISIHLFVFGILHPLALYIGLLCSIDR